MSQIVLQAVTAASVPTPASGRYAIFANSSDSNFPSQKDSSGTTTRLGTTGATGATGATGSTGPTGPTGGGAQLASIVAASAAIAATETVVVSASLTGGYLTAGKSFRIKAAGVGTTGVTPGSDVFRIRIGPTTLTGTIPTTVTALGIAAVTAQPFDFEAIITLRTSGASGAIIGECVLQVDSVATGRYAVLNSLSTTVATVAVDTTVTNLLELTYISGNAGSSNTFQVAEIEVLSSGAAGGVSPGTILGATTYSTGADTAWASTSSTTPADIDATNAALAITVPASGKIVVQASLDYTCATANNGGYLVLRSGSTNHQYWSLMPPNAAVGGIGGVTVSGGHANALFYVTGLTPGALTIKLGFSRLATTVLSVYAYDGTGAAGHLSSPFVMVAYAA